MFHVVLVEPEIPPNTGNVIRLCANSGAQLHLIHPLGFVMEDKQLRRAGLDYREWADVREHTDFDRFLRDVKPTRLFACSTKGERLYHQVHYRENDALVFGAETRGLSPEMMARFSSEEIVRIPMVPDSRSLNLSNAVSVILFEAWRQHDFAGSVDAQAAAN
ncbi:tRNA (uridine(34)/cytosine(34)/5-carboxymethylaminomethyluridine(34)-2'-O)-methyltransferase TrmL [Alkalilimnicola ehrlichii]|uniref:tRNA (cytidine(34)-2'-O)-methyltransferase n=1 Tax=Alkalilimnicola ehrlichii TaxID=351052 RepID=A0A3E0WYY2_9GAMM|nr:tRNA (uridine(34)/cytosine(34)/5-carboxymethylaminomethyluridine(34)-2'-O)-methyltransferase TrmL [Alkalilimnicola ehrlichii]RFA30667.1 tRNA (uridine(34)/cytosine(34)/5-carboxymethylaminomethyluridine(34)-2'-O)-methyltransferase TrmL [Alkalilimnicola ehrlichii]RFA38246.1 tRNA (uridine(34)/cytosine(34)/5-carboxymethylaminomethyluridine(34)-2'-O)-methyltransferase TrmL [Alkalilimnicola ehrlichii]